MNKPLLTFISILFALGMISEHSTANAAKIVKPQTAKKERLVIMPLRVPDEDRSLAGAMEAALVKGLQGRYEIFSGEKVQQKVREIFAKESRTAKKECDETRCMQDIAIAFQAELLATANVTKRADGYFIALSIQNIFDNKVVLSEAIPCKNCDAYQVVEWMVQRQLEWMVQHWHLPTP